MYHTVELSRTINVDTAIKLLSKDLPQGWRICKTKLPGRDLYVASSALSGVFISVKPGKKSTELNFNVCPPSVLLRGPLQLVSMFTSKPILDYVYQVFGAKQR